MAIRCASARSAGLPALRKEPQRPARISALIASESGAAIDVDWDICPSFSSSVMRASRELTRDSIAGCAAAGWAATSRSAAAAR